MEKLINSIKYALLIGTLVVSSANGGGAGFADCIRRACVGAEFPEDPSSCGEHLLYYFYKISDCLENPFDESWANEIAFADDGCNPTISSMTCSQQRMLFEKYAPNYYFHNLESEVQGDGVMFANANSNLRQHEDVYACKAICENAFYSHLYLPSCLSACEEGPNGSHWWVIEEAEAEYFEIAEDFLYNHHPGEVIVQFFINSDGNYELRYTPFFVFDDCKDDQYFVDSACYLLSSHWFDKEYIAIVFYKKTLYPHFIYAHAHYQHSPIGINELDSFMHPRYLLWEDAVQQNSTHPNIMISLGKHAEYFMQHPKSTNSANWITDTVYNSLANSYYKRMRFINSFGGIDAYDHLSVSGNVWPHNSYLLKYYNNSFLQNSAGVVSSSSSTTTSNFKQFYRDTLFSDYDHNIETNSEKIAALCDHGWSMTCNHYYTIINPDPSIDQSTTQINKQQFINLTLKMLVF